MTKPKIGDRVRLTGKDWEHAYNPPVMAGYVATVTEIDEQGSIWTDEAGTVGDRYVYYSKSNPTTAGDYSVELVEEIVGDLAPWEREILEDAHTLTTEARKIVEPIQDEIDSRLTDLSYESKTLEALEEIARLGESLGISTFEQNTRRILNRIGDTLVEKNRSYGNAALNPVNVFSKADRTEQIRVRIDDKLNRIRNGQSYPGDDDVDDLIGYLILFKMAGESE